MAWLIFGDRSKLTMAVSDRGFQTCHGTAKHEPAPPSFNNGNMDPATLARIKHAECAWSIHKPNDSGVHIDPAGEGLLQRLLENPEKCHGMIKFSANPSDFVGFSIVLPEPVFSNVWRLFEQVLSTDSLQYCLNVDFLGFRAPHAQTETPTSKEFVDEKPYFFDKISFKINAKNHIDT